MRIEANNARLVFHFFQALCYTSHATQHQEPVTGRNAVIKLLLKRRLDFVNSYWCMPHDNSGQEPTGYRLQPSWKKSACSKELTCIHLLLMCLTTVD